jgi:phosphate butyryltransferase
MAACATLPPMPTAVVAPEEESALLGALAGGRAGLIVPILLGDAAKIHAIAAQHGASLDGIAIEDLPSHDATPRAAWRWCMRAVQPR